MLDTLFNPKKAKNHPLQIIIIAMFYTSVSIILSAFIFPEHASLISVMFIVFACLYLTQKTIKKEETIEITTTEKNLLREHKKTIKLFLFLFLGMLISFASWNAILPTDKSQDLFSLQDKTIQGIENTKITGQTISNTKVFSIILSNNLKVLLTTLVISLLYGAGAIFVITWNASILGFVIGTLIKENGIISAPLIYTKYLLHGIPEIASYLTIILGGGILYFFIIKKDFKIPYKRKKTIKDFFILTGIAITLLIIAALIETYISPLI